MEVNNILDNLIPCKCGLKMKCTGTEDSPKDVYVFTCKCGHEVKVDVYSVETALDDMME